MSLNMSVLFYLTNLQRHFYRRLEAEANEKLGEVYQKLLQAGVDKTQPEKEAKLKETLASLQRRFPGM